MTDDSNDQRRSQLTDKAEVVGLDATDYDDDRITRVTTVSVATLSLQMDLLEMLGWETVDVITVDPGESQDEANPLLAFRPRAEGWFSEQAAVAAAPKSQPHGDTVLEVGDD